MSPPIYAEFLLIHTSPFAILAAVGAVLFFRHRTVAGGLFALGFLACVAGQISGQFMVADVSKMYGAHGDVIAAVGFFPRWAWALSGYADTIGIWIAAAGATMHLLRQRSARGIAWGSSAQIPSRSATYLA